MMELKRRQGTLEVSINGTRNNALDKYIGQPLYSMHLSLFSDCSKTACCQHQHESPEVVTKFRCSTVKAQLLFHTRHCSHLITALSILKSEIIASVACKSITLLTLANVGCLVSCISQRFQGASFDKPRMPNFLYTPIDPTSCLQN